MGSTEEAHDSSRNGTRTANTSDYRSSSQPSLGSLILKSASRQLTRKRLAGERWRQRNLKSDWDRRRCRRRRTSGVEPKLVACAATVPGNLARKPLALCLTVIGRARPCGHGGTSGLRTPALGRRPLSVGHVHVVGASWIFAESMGALNPTPVMDRDLSRSASPITSANPPPNSRQKVLKASMKGSQIIRRRTLCPSG